MPLVEKQIEIHGDTCLIKVSHTVNSKRLKIILNGLEELPRDFIRLAAADGVQGELVTTDEAEVWKRVLNYRLGKHFQFDTILETHAGKGIGTKLMLMANENSKITSLSHFQSQMPADKSFDFIDIDPWGFPYEALDLALPLLKDDGVLAITSGESAAVTRNLPNRRIETNHKGKDSWKYVEDDYIPFLEQRTGLKCQFFYAFPTSIRTILTNNKTPKSIFKDCPQYMWWYRTRKEQSENSFL